MPTHEEYLVQYNRGSRLWQVREGRAVNRFRDDFTVGSLVSTVLTGVDIVTNIPEGYRFMLTRMLYDLLSLNDWAHYGFGSCSAVDGGGAFTLLAIEKHLATGANRNSYGGGHDDWESLPLRVRYQDGARSVTIRVQVNDITAIVAVAYRGWLELDD